MKDVYYFSHDSNARRDPKIVALTSKYGPEGYGVYFMLIETMSEQHGYKIEKFPRMADGLARDMGIKTERLNEILTYILNDCELLKQDDRYIWSDSLMRRKAIQEEKRQDRIEAGRIGGLRSGQARSKTKQNEAPLQVNEAYLEATNQSKVNESKANESKILSSSEQQGFNEFWIRYPSNRANGGNKNEAIQVWAEVKPPLKAVLEALEGQLKSEQWTKECGKFVPSPVKWLSQRRWEDKPLPAAPRPTAPKIYEDTTDPKVYIEHDFYAQHIQAGKCSFCGGAEKPVIGCDCGKYTRALGMALSIVGGR